MRPDRYIEGGALGLELYESVAELPLVSPHGHIDVDLLAGPAARLEPPGRLFVGADHYVVRMLHSQGVPFEQTLGDDRDVWNLLVDNLHLFALTPSGLWLRETLANVFGVAWPPAREDYDRIEELLASPAFAPRALLERFGVECLSTTDPAGSTLASHRALADPRIRPTFRPDAVVALDAPGWRAALADLEAASGTEIGDYATFLDALAERRVAFKQLGATATDHAATSADTTRLDDPASVFAEALRGEPVDARAFEAHMLNEFARMSCDDGLVMQLHVGSLRNHDRPLAARFGPDIGSDIPVATDWTRGPAPAARSAWRRHRVSASSSTRSTRAPTAASSRRLPATTRRCCSAAHGGSTTARPGSRASSTASSRPPAFTTSRASSTTRAR